MCQEFCLNHSSGINEQNVLSRILDQARLTGGLPKPVFLAFLSVALICVSRPRGECHVQRFFLSVYFRLQSTRPRGARPTKWIAPASRAVFQSTRPHGGATQADHLHQRARPISIHAPAWARLYSPSARRTLARFQSTRPAWGRDFRCPPPSRLLSHFNPRAPCGARRDMQQHPADCA